MGKSALPLVLSQLTVVNPPNGSPYVRSKRSIQTSPKLKAYQSCIRQTMRGQRYGSQAEASRAFSAAASSCRGGRGAPAPSGGRRWAAKR